jgi:uncharacterized protein involved in type VI secretion and phage assembly
MIESESIPNKFFGKFRGMVLNNIDPMQMGRLQVQVPDVSNLLPTSWALPCFPFAGKQMGMWAIPQIGAGVWVEFEQGNPDYPIWSGCFYGSVAEVPALALTAPPPLSDIVLQTALQNTLLISDMAGPTGGILLKTMTGAMISINDVGITISNGKGATIIMSGPSVTINAGAMVII